MKVLLLVTLSLPFLTLPTSAHPTTPCPESAAPAVAPVSSSLPEHVEYEVKSVYEEEDSQEGIASASASISSPEPLPEPLPEPMSAPVSSGMPTLTSELDYDLECGNEPEPVDEDEDKESQDSMEGVASLTNNAPMETHAYADEDDVPADEDEDKESQDSMEGVASLTNNAPMENHAYADEDDVPADEDDVDDDADAVSSPIVQEMQDSDVNQPVSPTFQAAEINAYAKELEQVASLESLPEPEPTDAEEEWEEVVDCTIVYPQDSEDAEDEENQEDEEMAIEEPVIDFDLALEQAKEQLYLKAEESSASSPVVMLSFLGAILASLALA